MVNDAPVEAVIKPIAYWMRARASGSNYKFLDVGCGGGATMEWIAKRGGLAFGFDASEEAVEIARGRLVGRGVCLSVCDVRHGIPYLDAEFDVVTEANVIQHLPRGGRVFAYREIARVLKPGGLFVGYCLSQSDTVYRRYSHKELVEDPGTIILSEPGVLGTLPTIGLAHFAKAGELDALLSGFEVELLPVSYRLPSTEAKRRGFDGVYENHFFVVHAVKKETA